MTWFIVFSSFTAVSLLIVAAYYLVFAQPGQILDRLDQVGRQAAGGTMTAPLAVPIGWNDVMRRIVHPFGNVFKPSKQAANSLKRRLNMAGLYGENADINYSGTRMLLGVILPLIATAVISALGMTVLRFFFFLPILALIGYSLPSMWLSSRINGRKVKITHGLADALDLMVSCVEAGLSLNAALIRVSAELATAHPDIAKEFEITSSEIRAGKPREEALRSLGQRTGVKDLKSLAAMLIQTDRFGTSIARALRVFSDTLRTKRRQRAEEAAAKTTIKLVFPLVLFIFPAILLVLLGPGVIRLMETFANLNR